MFYLFEAINDSIFKLMMLTERDILLKNMLVVILSKISHHSFIPTLYKNFKSVFLH